MFHKNFDHTVLCTSNTRKISPWLQGLARLILSEKIFTRTQKNILSVVGTARLIWQRREDGPRTIFPVFGTNRLKKICAWIYLLKLGTAEPTNITKKLSGLSAGCQYRKERSHNFLWAPECEQMETGRKPSFIFFKVLGAARRIKVFYEAETGDYTFTQP